MNSQDYLDKNNTFYQLALNETDINIRRKLYDLINYTCKKFLETFNEEIEDEH